MYTEATDVKTLPPRGLRLKKLKKCMLQWFKDSTFNGHPEHHTLRRHQQHHHQEPPRA